MVSSDGIYHGARPHPRGYGTFVRILGRYVRELGVLGLEDAVRRMSGLPAERFAIRDRGLVAEGLAADLVVFDPATVGGPATWEEPRRTAVGIDAVIVNGQVVAEDGQPTGALPGRVVDRSPRLMRGQDLTPRLPLYIVDNRGGGRAALRARSSRPRRLVSTPTSTPGEES